MKHNRPSLKVKLPKLGTSVPQLKLKSPSLKMSKVKADKVKSVKVCMPKLPKLPKLGTSVSKIKVSDLQAPTVPKLEDSPVLKDAKPLNSSLTLKKTPVKG
ncbi:hypothetical protein Cva_01625 [Caedimonas varicaedens]|uniref:Uncharacterized protein n=1 Tax=Caedimonas varicaedens TaxID=1629334 RepID=A0A0K8MEM3_9PROT|nr:hypothetical protein Cva_01625 [Caedimonas varicaedens]